MHCPACPPHGQGHLHHPQKQGALAAEIAQLYDLTGASDRFLMSRYAHTERMFKIMQMLVKSAKEYYYGVDEPVSRPLQVQSPIEAEAQLEPAQPAVSIEMVHLRKR